MKTSLTAAGLCAAALIGLGVWATPPAEAQQISPYDQPAEIPPASFTGRQYIDSRGCAYIRVGVDAATAWVPRVSRRREVLCGFQPTRTAAAPLPVIPDAPGVSPAPVRTAAAEMPRPVRAAPQPYRQVPVRPHAHPVPLAGHGGALPGNTYGRLPNFETGGARAGSGLAVGTVLSAPPVAGVSTPPGYREVWTDGRLNPHRGKQTLSGALQTALVWTQTVPRRLVDPRSGKDMTRKYNYLVYPYTDYHRQQRDLAGGTHIVVEVSGQRMIVARSALKTTANGRTVISTKSLRGAVPGN